MLRLLSEQDEPIGVTDISKRLDMDKAAVHRLLAALVDEGLAEQDPVMRRYSLGLGVVELATARMRKVSVAGCALPHMEALRDQINETVALLVPEGRTMACALVCESRQTVRVSFFVGERMPIYGTSSGMAWLSTTSRAERRDVLLSKMSDTDKPGKQHITEFLAGAERAASKGYSAMLDSYMPGAGGVAANLMDGNGTTVGVLVIGALTSNLVPERVAEIGDLLIRTASQISKDLVNGTRSSIRRIV